VVEHGLLASECLYLWSMDQNEEVVVELSALKHAYALSGIAEECPEWQLSLDLSWPLPLLLLTLTAPESLLVYHRDEDNAAADPVCLALQ
jgi:hypothetical protein